MFSESYTPVINGVTIAVNWLADALGERGHEVVVFAPRFPGHYDPPGRVVRFPSFFPPGHPDYPVAIPLAPGVFRRFRQGKFDLAHSHAPFATGQAARRWTRRLGIPLLTTYHTLYAEYAHYAGRWIEKAARRWLIRLSRRYCEAADAVVVPTDPIRAVLEGYGVRRPIRVIPTGLPQRPPPPPDPEFPRATYGIPADAPLILYVGRLAREKNLELLFGAFARVAREMPEVWLLVAGGGPGFDEARALARASGVEDRIVMPGFIPHDRLPLCYVAATVLAFSSMTDTQGLVLIEAKACGLPAVAVEAQGPTVIVRDGIDGYLTPNDPDRFAARLLELVRDPVLRVRMARAAREDAARFDIRTTAAQYEILYTALVEGSLKG